MSIEVSKDKSTILYVPPEPPNDLNPGANILHAISLYAVYGSQAMKEAFLVIATHGSSDGQSMETGTHVKLFQNSKEIRENLRGRSILYISCWGGELGAEAASKFLPNTPVVSCGSGIYASVKKNPFRMTLRSDPFMNDLTTKKPETGANRYRNWVIGFNGIVTEQKSVGVIFKDDYFIRECGRLKRG